jgi:predicted Zn-dependent protease
LDPGPFNELVHAALEDLTGAWEHSDQRCARALKTAPPLYHGELYRCRAAAAVHQGRVHRGMKLLQAGLAVDDQNPELYIALGQAQLASGLPHSAHATLLKLLHLDGGADAALLGRARRMVDEAKRLAAPPMTPLDQAEQADLTALMESGQADADDIAHVRELAQQTEQPQLLSACALILLRGPDPGLGRKLLDRAAKALPLDADPSRLLAVYHLAQADYAGALPALLQAVRAQPFDPESQVMLATVAARLGHWELSHEAYKALVQLEPQRQSHRAGLDEARTQLRQQAAQEGAGGTPSPQAPRPMPAQP